MEKIQTLLIDNYDSFTYNLYQLISEVNGQPPLVVRNDADWSTIPLHKIDNIVISPGPGRPDRAEDFGISTTAILESGLPILGVCLGHQGIAHLFGGNISHAPEPMHGRLSEIRHTGVDIFADFPSSFSVVRYHSLVVTELSRDLEAIAWSQDGLIMGLRHLTLPIWGVQFHPESICSELGQKLFANFLKLTQSYMRQDLQSSQKDGDNRIHVRKLAIYPDAQSTFQEIFSPSKHAFWLDSSNVMEGLSRFSYLGDGTGPYAEYITYRVAEGVVNVNRNGQAPLFVQKPFFDYLNDQLRIRAADSPDNIPFSFNLGYVGYIGYEMKAETCGSVCHLSETPDAALLFTDRMMVLDHLEKTTYLICLTMGGNGHEADVWFNHMQKRLVTLPTKSNDPFSTVLATMPDHQLKIDFRHDRASYLQLINECLEEIRNGESYEICLTNTATVHTSIDPWKTYTHLRRISPVPYGGFLRFPDMAVLSASPERFLSISSERVAESKPIKGTRKRGETPSEDNKLREELLNEEKDRAENLMIVDLVRNDLNMVCQVDTVHVPHLFYVETYSTVHQLISTIRGTLRPGKSTVDCVQAAFPGGSMTGAPKIRTMEIIDRLEKGARGVYSGSLGWFGLNGAADLNIIIRTLVVYKDKVTFGVGGAITAMSDPIKEYEEIMIKARAMISSIATANEQQSNADVMEVPL